MEKCQHVAIHTLQIVLLHARCYALENLARLDDTLELLHNRVADIGLFANDEVLFVLRIVGVPELAVGSQLKLEKFMPEFARMTDAAEQTRGEKA